MKNRLARVNELIQRELGGIIQRDFEFPGLLVTINGVDITPDLKHCHVFIGVLGGQPDQEEVIEKLMAKRSFLQKRLMSRITLKQTPHLHFKLDHSVERGVRITTIMEGIDAEIGKDAWKSLPLEEREEQP
jgi:ribosome-binding factor A